MNKRFISLLPDRKVLNDDEISISFFPLLSASHPGYLRQVFLSPFYTSFHIHYSTVVISARSVTLFLPSCVSGDPVGISTDDSDTIVYQLFHKLFDKIKSLNIFILKCCMIL